MKRIVLFFLIAYSVGLSPLSVNAQTTGDYRTVGSGNWASPGTWEIFTGLSWIPAVSSPTYLNGAINIRNGHTVTVTASTTVDNMTIDAGGTLVLASNTLQLGLLGLDNLICNGSLELSGGDLNMVVTSTVSVNGSMLWTDGDIISGTVNINSGGVLTLNTSATKDLLLVSTININSGGTMNWDDGDINLNLTGGILNNNGTISTSCNNSISGLGTFNNNSGGIFRKTSTGTTTFNVFVTSILGTFKGLGTYDFNNLFLNAGTISPGLSPGIVLVTYSDLDPSYPLLGTNSDIDIEIKDGTGAGTGHDQVVKNGNLKLGGTLRVTETGTVPDGTYAIVLVTGAITGSFDNVILPADYTLDVTSSIVLVTKTSSTLPVKLTNFTAKKIDKAVQLNWQTATESNSDRFEIERSKAGGAFVKIGEVNAAGNSNQLMNYLFADNNPNKGLNIYRLKQVDKDNKFEYSATRLVRIDDTKDELYVFPTITNGMVSVLSDEKTIVELYNLQGIRLLKKEINSSEQFDLTKYPSGAYLLRNLKDGRSYKIIKR